MGIKIREKGELVLFKDMKQGEVGEIVETPALDYKGLLVIACSCGEDMVVGLDGSCWDGLGNVAIKVRLLPKGTLLEVI